MKSDGIGGGIREPIEDSGNGKNEEYPLPHDLVWRVERVNRCYHAVGLIVSKGESNFKYLDVVAEMSS